MIAIDTSSFIAYLSGKTGRDVEAVDMALEYRQGVLPPVVLTEILSDPQLPKTTAAAVRQLPLLEILDGYWERAGNLRAKLISKRRKAPVADVLISQACIDHDVALITRDQDFRGFGELTGLKLFVPDN